MKERVRRSWLIVPAHKTDLVSQASTAKADVVVLDLEDTVHETRKAEARQKMREAIQLIRNSGSEVFVRCDPDFLYADLEASVYRGLTGVLLPRITSVEQVQDAEQTVAEFEAQRGVRKPPPVGEILEVDESRTLENSLEMHLCLDTGRGNWDAPKLIGASPRVRAVSLGRADLTMDLRPEPEGDLHLMPYLAQRLILVANATGVQPIGAWWRGASRGLVDTPQNTYHAAVAGRKAGFKGALCMRANQVEALNRGFTPSNEELSQAQAILDAFAAAQARGFSRAMDHRQLIDQGIAGAASRLLELAAACKATDEAKLHPIEGA